MNYLLEEENSTFLLFTQSFFCCKKKYEIKFNALCHYENSMQMRTPTNCI